MSMEKWLRKNGCSLAGKTVVITGATGGLGSAMCRYFLSCSADLILVNRSEQKSQALKEKLLQEFPGARISWYLADLEDYRQVKTLCRTLKDLPVDVLMLNAGTYAIPRAKCPGGYDNVFTTNFIAHYLMVKELLPTLEQRKARIVATGSISHRFNLSDPEDVDFSGRSNPNHVYGNSKRYLMFALSELLKEHPAVSFGIGHPGISFTGITSHYPSWMLKIVKPSMLLLFMHPQKACRSMVKAVFTDLPYLHWLGPAWFDIWGNPSVKELTHCPEAERRQIYRRAEEIYEKLQDCSMV